MSGGLAALCIYVTWNLFDENTNVSGSKSCLKIEPEDKI